MIATTAIKQASATGVDVSITEADAENGNRSFQY